VEAQPPGRGSPRLQQVGSQPSSFRNFTKKGVSLRNKGRENRVEYEVHLSLTGDETCGGAKGNPGEATPNLRKKEKKLIRESNRNSLSKENTIAEMGEGGYLQRQLFGFFKSTTF